MQYNLTTLKNKLRVLTVPLPSLESACVSVWVKAGSRNEAEKISGLSHFLEHMAFKGGKKYRTSQETSYILDALGAEYNAGTSSEWTNFFIKARSEKLDNAFEILADMILNARLDEKEIEKEKGVIIEEIAMHEDTPMWNINDIFNELIFPDSPLGRDIAGIPDTVRSFKRNDFIKYRRLHYHPGNMLITVSGGVAEKESINLSEKYFGDLKNGRKPDFERFIPKQGKPALKLKSKKTEQAHFILGFLGNPRDYKKRYAEGLLSAILGKGMSSRLFEEIRQKRGLAYSIHTSVSRYIDTGTFETYEGVKVNKIKDAIKATLDQFYGLKDKKFAITKEELAKVKEYVKGRTALALEDTVSVNDFFGERALFLDKIRTPEEEFENIDKVTIDDIYEVAKDLFVPDKLNLAIIGPYKDEEQFVKILSK
ncbi:MAG: Peptidase M16 domain protein [Candidatus Woesebacteria bacterium GW2011_GWB1_38_8]|uniref:Peptidase M16 domain protein n=1 Tax=Candidatus Woesebacteria bacterium GW2011_GWB1_38_8 TaxID=1618570 RepID=A0A0G0KZT7_9BACT|nr:MAG: Peptidase M16 domain protein [Candidatus Woesebacteria bacterium GW2011_GWB1_38_8]